MHRISHFNYHCTSFWNVLSSIFCVLFLNQIFQTIVLWVLSEKRTMFPWFEQISWWTWKTTGDEWWMMNDKIWYAHKSHFNFFKLLFISFFSAFSWLSECWSNNAFRTSVRDAEITNQWLFIGTKSWMNKLNVASTKSSLFLSPPPPPPVLIFVSFENNKVHFWSALFDI